MLEQMQAQRHASAQYQHPIDGPHPQPGQAKAHSAFEPASQLTPPPSFREPGPVKPSASGRSSGSEGARTPKDGSSGGGNHGGSPRDGGANNSGDQVLLERMPSRPRASRASPTGPPLNIAAAASPAAAGKGDGGGIVPLAGKDRDVLGSSGASGRSSNASAASGFQPYRADSGSMQKRTISGTRLDGESAASTWQHASLLLCSLWSLACLGNCWDSFTAAGWLTPSLPAHLQCHQGNGCTCATWIKSAQ